MKICEHCGVLNDDSEIQCKICQALLPEVKKARGKTAYGGKRKSGTSKKFGNKPGTGTIKLIAGVLSLAMIVGICASFLVTGVSGQIDRAWNQNLEAVPEAVSVLPQFASASENLTTFHDGGKFSVKLDLTADVLDVAGTMDYDRKGKMLSGTMAYLNQNQELDVKFDFASDNEIFTLTADQYTEDIYGFKLTEFAEFYAKTPIALFFPLKNSKDEPNVDFFKKINYSKIIKDKYGEAWGNFRKSLNYEELNEREMEIGGQMIPVRTYEITWDTAAASKLISTVLGRGKEHISILMELFKVMEPDCRIYVDESDYIVAMDFVTAGNKCTIKLEGNDNIWNQCTLTSVSITGGEGTIRGNLTIDDGGIDAKFKWDGMMSYELEYRDSTGDFSMSALTGDISWYLDGTLTSNNGGSQLRVGGFLPSYGRIDISAELNPLENKPEMMGDKYVDLMDMDVSNWQRLLIDINNRN